MMLNNGIRIVSDPIEATITKDSQWKAYIPIISTHFQLNEDKSNVVPNT